MAKNFIPTNQKMRGAIRKIAGTDFETLTGYERPSDTKLKKGTEKAKVEKIELRKYAEDGWTVKTETGRILQAQLSSDYGIDWLPEGEIKNGYLYPTEDIYVDIVPDSYGNGTNILSTGTPTIDEPIVGATIISRGQSKVIIKDDSIEITTPKLIINGEEYTVD